MIRKTIIKEIKRQLFKRREIITYYKGEDAQVFDLIKAIKKRTDFLLQYGDAYSIYSAVRSVEHIKGDIAELGTFSGGSANLICEAKGKKNLHLFDTFEGLPGLSELDDPTLFNEGKYKATLEFNKELLKNYKNVFFYKGLFPKTAGPIKDKRFSFVHMDFDLYIPTLEGLKFFYERLLPGGIIICHDFKTSSGIKAAFANFFKDKPEAVIPLRGNQCLVVKL